MSTPPRENAKSRRMAARAAGTHPSKLKRLNTGSSAPTTKTQREAIASMSRALGLTPRIPQTWAEAEHEISRLRAKRAIERGRHHDKVVEAQDLAPIPDDEYVHVRMPSPELLRRLQTEQARAGLRTAIPGELTHREAVERLDALREARRKT